MKNLTLWDALVIDRYVRVIPQTYLVRRRALLVREYETIRKNNEIQGEILSTLINSTPASS